MALDGAGVRLAMGRGTRAPWNPDRRVFAPGEVVGGLRGTPPTGSPRWSAWSISYTAAPHPAPNGFTPLERMVNQLRTACMVYSPVVPA